jgi:hypothetical protein
LYKQYGYVCGWGYSAIDSLSHTPSYFHDLSESSLTNNNINSIIPISIIPNLPDTVALAFIDDLKDNLGKIDGATLNLFLDGLPSSILHYSTNNQLNYNDVISPL